ncbi:MAG TPA: PAS domain S-box protein, partial [Candidatus Limnocylindrales bacterium]|nr:PAS domain S-box protein [Candidatus Limnocylindrales bacterium]
MTDVEGLDPPDPVVGTDPLSPTTAPAPTAAPSDALAAVPIEVVRQSLDAIIVTDPDHLIHGWNPAAARLYGLSEEDAIGHRFRDLWSTFEPDGTPLDVPAARELLEREGTWRGRVVQRPAGETTPGREVIVDTITILLRDAAGTANGILVVNRDVSDSARVEAEIATLGSLVVATDRARSKTEVAEAALDILCRATGADAGLVTSMDRAYEAMAHRGVGPQTIEVILALGRLGGPLAEALQAPDAYINADVATAPLRDDVRAAVLADGIVHLVVVGLRLSGRLLGMLSLGWRQPIASPPSKAILLQAAALTAAAIENARLLEAVESGLAQERTLTGRFRALLELTRLPDAAPIDGLGLERLVADIGSIIGADSAILARIEGERLTPIAADRAAPGTVEALLEWPLIDPAVRTRLEGGHPAFIAPTSPEPIGTEAPGEYLSPGYRTVAAFPIREDGRLTALLFSLFVAPVEELDVDERTLEAIGRVLDISFVNRSLRQVVAASETRYRALFERSPDALLVESADDIVLDANPAARRMYGGDLIGRHVDDLVEGERRDIDTRSKEFRRHGVVNHIGVGRRLDGSTFPKEVDLHPLAIEGEARVLAIVRDMTERTRLQAELIQAQKMEAIG